MIRNRDEKLYYLNTGDDYALLGQGITDGTTSPNAKTSSTQFIHQKTASGGVSGYAPATKFSMQVDDTDAANLYIQDVASTLETGEKAHVTLVELETWKSTDNARKRTGVITIDNADGAAGDPLACDWTFTDNADPVIGTFTKDASTGKWTFTPKTSA